MLTKQSCSSLPSPEEFDKYLELSQDIIIPPMSEEDLARTKIVLEKMHVVEKQFPILKLTEGTYKVFQLREAIKRAQRILNDELDYIAVTDITPLWLNGLEEDTRIKYASYMTDLLNRNAIPLTFSSGQDFSVGGLRHINQKSIIEYIEQMTDLSEAARKARIECYISFTIYLERITDGWFRRVQPVTSLKRSAYRSTLKTTWKALSLEDLKKFNAALAKNNYRDYLIALSMFYGIARISDVLELTLDRVDFHKNIIRFPQTKNNIVYERPVDYPESFMKKLADYIASTQEQRKDSNYVFITRKGRPLTRSRINHSFTQASNDANIKHVQPDTMRATWLALSQSYKNIINEVPIED